MTYRHATAFEDAYAAAMRTDPAATGPRWPNVSTNISAACKHVLDVLGPDYRTAAEIAAALGLTPETARGRMQRLVSLGLAEREPDPSTGRKAIARWRRTTEDEG